MDDLIKREDALEAILDDSTDTVMKAWFNVKNVPSVEPTELYDYVFKAGYDKGVKDAITSAVKGMSEHIGIIVKKTDRKTEPQLTEKCPFDDSLPCEWVCTEFGKCKYKYKQKDEPQTDCSWK